MNIRAQRLCVWSGVAFMALFFVGFGVVARFIPPPSPTLEPEAVATLYRDHADGIRLGMVLSLYALVLYVPWSAVISVQLKRIEGQHAPLAYAQLALGAGLPVAFFPSLYHFANAAFRPERSPEIVVALNDQGWLPFTGIIYAIVVQNLLIAYGVLSDKRPVPVFPRWFGYFSLWTALLYCPAGLDVFFTAGPLAWDGLFTWWLSLVAFFLWLIVTTVLLLRAIARQEVEELDQLPDAGAEGDQALRRIVALESRIVALESAARARPAELRAIDVLGSCP